MMLFILFVGLQFASCKYIVQSKDNVLCDSTQYAQEIYNKLANSSFSKMYSITKGYAVWFENVTYWVGNPDGRYATYVIPPPGLYDGSNGIYLRSRDAIIFAGCTPPISRYFSWDSYLFNRYSGNGTQSEWLFASVGEALNNLVINTTSNNNNTFNQLTTVITTGDKQTFNDINHAVNSTKNDINLRPIPLKWFNFMPYGININNNIIPLNITYDTFVPLIRFALPENQQQYKQYVSINQTIFYLTPRNVPNGTNTPRIPLINETRNIYSSQNMNETEIYLNSLNQYTKDLIYNLSTTYKQLTYISMDNFTNQALDPSWNYGFSCIEGSFGCWGDNRDALYWYYRNNVTCGGQYVYVIVGVNSFNVNLTSYSSFCYYYHGYTISSQDSLTNFEIQDTVIDLNINTSVSIDELSNFYVIQYGSLQNLIPNIPAIKMEPQQNNQLIEFFNRDYLNPITHTRPDANQMIPPIVLKFYVNQTANYTVY